MPKGPYEDIPDENVIFNYASSRNISFHGAEDSGITLEEWRQLTLEEQTRELEDWLWGSEIVEIWATEEDEGSG